MALKITIYLCSVEDDNDSMLFVLQLQFIMRPAVIKYTKRKSLTINEESGNTAHPSKQ